MKNITLLFLLTIAATLPLSAQRMPMLESLKDDADIKTFIQLTNRRYPRPGAGAAQPHEQLFARDKTAQEMHQLVRGWLESHPSDALGRAWMVLNYCYYTVGPEYLKEIKADYDDRLESEGLLVRDEVARAKSQAERLEWLKQVRHDPAVSTEARSSACVIQFNQISARAMKSKAELGRLSEEVEAMVAARELSETDQAYVYFRMIYFYRGYGAAAFDDYLAMLSKHGSRVARQSAADESTMLQKLRAGLDWIKFTAMDGREVDLSKMRGKVVLVDFGATWCVPCVAEIPGMVEAYAKYRGKGFEIVGLSLERANVTESDTKEQAAAKIAKERKKLEALITKLGVTWPVYFETRGLENEFCARLGMVGVPAMFLVDHEGRVVSTAVRGEALDREVKRLLKL